MRHHGGLAMRMTSVGSVLASAAFLALAGSTLATTPFRVVGFDPNSVRFDVTNLVERAKANDAKANYELGVMFLCGHQVPQNRYVAYDYFSKSSDLGYGYASLLLGWCGEFGGGYKELGLSMCETQPYRALIAERGDYVLYGLRETVKLKPREYYELAISNGVVEAENFLNRLERHKQADERRNRAMQAARRRVASGDCRNDKERKEYARQQKYKRENEERRAKIQRVYAEQQSNRVAAVVREATKWQASQVERLVKFERSNSADELYWAACFLRAWAATASADDPGRRVGLAQRSLDCLRRASDKGHLEATFRLGLMLWGGDTGILGPEPQGRGGFLDFNSTNRVMHEWVPERLEVVKNGDLKGPSFAPYVRVKKIVDGGAVTNIENVLIYEQDVARGMALVRKAAEDGFAEAKSWLASRKAEGVADDYMPWMLDRQSFDNSKGRDCLEITVCTRSNGFLGRVFRKRKYDRKTGELVAQGAEDPQNDIHSPWVQSTH